MKSHIIVTLLVFSVFLLKTVESVAAVNHAAIESNDQLNIKDKFGLKNLSHQTQTTTGLANTAGKAWRDAISGGKYGALAGVLQVFLMMWLRTVTQYQHRYGVTTMEAFTVLYSQGGIRRFYRGLTYALIQTPLSRFGSIASNEGAKSLTATMKNHKYKMILTTSLGTLLASIWRFNNNSSSI